MESTGFLPLESSRVHELCFFNLEGVCQAEKEILHKIIHNSQWYSDSLFCFMRRSPSPSASNVESCNPCLTEPGCEVENDGVPEVSGDPDNVSGCISDEGSQVQNGPIAELSHPQQHNEGNAPAVINQVVTSTSIRPFYPSQPLLTPSTAGTGQPMPPTSVQIPVSGGQMVMYSQQMQQLMQPSHGGYPMPVGYPPLHYGYPQHGGQPHVTYVSPSGEPISPESVHLAHASSHKGHHDGNHGIPHSHTSGLAGPGGSGGYSKNRNHRRDNVKPQQPPYYYSSYGYTTGMPYHSHQQLAQNVTGSPIIMQASGNIYPYHQQHQIASEMDHHPSNVGMPPQTIGHMTSELPPYAQPHIVPPMYHHSPTHSGNRGGNYSQSSRGNPVQVPIELPPNLVTSTELHAEAEKTNDVKQESDITQAAVSPDESVSVGHVVETESTTLEIEDSRAKSLGSNVDSLTEPSRDTKVVDKIPTPTSPLQPTLDKRSFATETVNPDSITGSTVSSSQTKSSPKFQEAAACGETTGVNGDIKDTKIKAGKGAHSDNSSAEPAVVGKRENLNARQPGNIAKNFESKKSHLNVSNSRSVNAISNLNSSIVSTCTKDVSSKKLVSESGSGEFPQLLSNSVGNSNNSSVTSGNAGSACSVGGAAKGRSWASIASVKSQLGGSDGANQSLKRCSGSYPHGADQGCGDSVAGRLSDDLNSCVLPNCPSAKAIPTAVECLIDNSATCDGNDPIALSLGEFLRNYALDHHSIALTPRGLSNQGNYCYINATLQALLACPPFVNLFRAVGETLNQKPCRGTPIIQNVYELVKEFEPLLRGNASKKDRIKDVFNVGANLEPIGIRKCLGLLEGNTFKVEGRQEDAEEFLSHLLNGLHDEMLKVMKWVEQHREKSSGDPTASSNASSNLGSTNGGAEISGDEDDDQWQVMGAKNKSCVTRKTTVSKTPVSEAFLGQMCYLYRVTSTGSQKSATLQPFYTLQLDIQNDNIRSVRDALEAISAKEEVSGMLSATGSEIEAWRQLSLEELPVVLILHLKRFVYEKNGNKIRKIDKKLDFGIDLEIGKDLLSVTAKTKYNPRQRQYKLFAVVYHDGEEAHKGHYIADCFHASGGSMWGQCGWLRFDDTSVKQIPESQMLNPQPPRVPYLLYYRRGDTLLSHVTQQQQHKKDRP